MFKKSLIALAVCSFALSACSDSDDNDDTTMPLSLEGNWVAPAYGLALTIEAADFQYYQFTGQTCQTFDAPFEESYEQLSSDVQLAADGQVLLNSFFGAKVPPVDFERQTLLPESCVSSLVANFDEDGFVDDAIRDFDIFWQNFNDYYAFFELKQVDWMQQRDIWRPEVTADISDFDLLDILARMIEPLADGHVEVASADGELDFDFGGKPTFFDTVEQEFEQLPAGSEVEIDEYFEEQIERAFEILADSFEEDAPVIEHESGQAVWSVLPNNIGYLNLFAMAGYTDSEFPVDQLDAVDEMFDDIIDDLADVDSMIIDLRFNGGGDDGTSARIASRFADERTLGWQKQARLGDTRLPLSDVFIEPTTRSSFLKPVVLLTSTATASAAEVFTLAMREVADARLVGEATQGIFSDILPKSLPNGITFTMSSEYYFSADGEFLEDQGVPVDVEAAFFTLEDRQNGQDTGLMAAQELLRN
ncbi:MAG: S41 family peptidase [Granulosicoccus sp.]